MKSVKLCAAVATAIILQGCVMLPTPGGQRYMCRAIEMALTKPEDKLEKSWFVEDQFAAAIALRYGLNGTPRDEARAAAILDRLTTPEYDHFTYEAKATSSTPAHTVSVPTVTYPVSPYELNIVENCLNLLSGSAEPPQAVLDSGVCGGAEYYHHLKALWAVNGPH